MGSRSRQTGKSRGIVLPARDLGSEHVGKFVSLVWDWEWEDYSETIEGILVSATYTDSYYHSVNIATIPDRPDFISGYGMWDQQVTVSKTIPQQWHRVAHFVNKNHKAKQIESE